MTTPPFATQNAPEAVHHVRSFLPSRISQPPNLDRHVSTTSGGCPRLLYHRRMENRRRISQRLVVLYMYVVDVVHSERRWLTDMICIVDTAGLSEDEESLEANGRSLEEKILGTFACLLSCMYMNLTPCSLDGASDSSSSQPTWPAGVSWEDGLKFSSQEDLLAWVNTLPQIIDEQNEEDSSPSSSTSDGPSEPTLPTPPPIFAVEQEQSPHFVPPPKEHKRFIRGHRSVDTEDLRLDVANNLRWQLYVHT